MLWNMLNDLAEAMKALDGKKKRHGRLVENTLLITEGILYVTNLYHNILLVFGLIISDIRIMSLIRSNTDCGVLISSTSYSGFDLSLVQLIAWTEGTYIGLTLRLFLVSWTLNIVKLILSKWWEHS